MFKILVSGSNGLIGSHIIKLNGYEVYPIPRETLLQTEKLRVLVKEINPDYIIHCASYGNQHYQTDSEKITLANVSATYSMLDACSSIDYEAFVFLSSSSVYGEHNKPLKEDMELKGDSLYARAKVLAEFACKQEFLLRDKPVVIVRPFSIYGYGEQEHRFMPTLIKALTSGDTIDLVAKSMHDWLDVDSFVDGLMFIVDNIDILKGQVVNLGSGKQHTNLEVLERIEWIANKTIHYKEIEKMRDNEQSNWQADMTKLHDLGWYPKYDLISGLKVYLKEYEKSRAKA